MATIAPSEIMSVDIVPWQTYPPPPCIVGSEAIFPGVIVSALGMHTPVVLHCALQGPALQEIAATNSRPTEKDNHHSRPMR